MSSADALRDSLAPIANTTTAVGRALVDFHVTENSKSLHNSGYVLLHHDVNQFHGGNYQAVSAKYKDIKDLNPDMNVIVGAQQVGVGTACPAGFRKHSGAGYWGIKNSCNEGGWRGGITCLQEKPIKDADKYIDEVKVVAGTECGMGYASVSDFRDGCRDRERLLLCVKKKENEYMSTRCSTGAVLGIGNHICDQWCNQNTAKCHASMRDLCANRSKWENAECKKWYRDYKEQRPFDAAVQYCAADPANRFKSKDSFCRQLASTHEGDPGVTDAVHRYCLSNPDDPWCGCDQAYIDTLDFSHLKPDFVKDIYRYNPQCFIRRCALATDTVYRNKGILDKFAAACPPIQNCNIEINNNVNSTMADIRCEQTQVVDNQETLNYITPPGAPPPSSSPSSPPPSASTIENWKEWATTKVNGSDNNTLVIGIVAAAAVVVPLLLFVLLSD